MSLYDFDDQITRDLFQACFVDLGKGFRGEPGSGVVAAEPLNPHDRSIPWSCACARHVTFRGKIMAQVAWFDDLTVGMRFKSPEVVVTEADIKRFATEFDPQPMHLDHEAAKDTLFNGLAASGWHTAAIAMNLAIQTRPFGPHPLIGAGVDGLRWTIPVRPNDRLHLVGEVMSLTPSKSKPQGIALVKWTMFNQNGEEVYTFTPIAIVPRRP
jgi:acyl dehydratase